ncbi:MAG: M20/M25/M40 family metallo-hydrolase [Desulfitobacteriaceae bacterium]|nr:M20/M25/M40 family metallo-hydrolase [Desulfitobacteriaceae bacterium]MDI6879473.1 M20/M25/M40 family metallo-hydrolase [Desulfitobacteriaceae bacterium]MDI6912934.1 M20/M25/M40 family metallo-hydrolase [Desulfitobacteriaceae bacterium]
MSTRRTFLKTMVAASAFFLPWTHWPKHWEAMLAAWSVEAKVHLTQHEPPLANPTADSGLAAHPTAGSSSAAHVELARDIAALASPQCEGRKAGTAGEAKAAQYLMAEMRELGLKPVTGASYIQAFTLPPMTERRVGGRLTFQAGAAAGEGLRAPSANLLGFLPGERGDEIMLLSAHYDHLGLFEGERYPGANDNASGVACVMRVLRRLLQAEVPPKRTLLVAFWSGEEMGFLGSKAFVQNPPLPLVDIKAVLNVDTVGNGQKGDFALWAYDNNAVVKALQAAAKTQGASAPLVPGGGHNSDQISFAQVGIPAATLMARAWLENNHTVKDVPDFVNKDQIQLASEVVYEATLNLGR